MSLIEDIKKIDAHYFSAYILIFCAVISPGVLIIQLFHPTYFSSLAITKLLLLAASISLPLPVINTFIAGYSEGKDEVELKDAVMFSCLMSFLCIYTAILISFLLSLKFRSFIYIVVLIEVGFLIASIVLNRMSRKSS